MLLAPTSDDVARRGLLDEAETLWLDRGYDSVAAGERLAQRGIDDAVVAKGCKGGSPAARANQPMALGRLVERTSSWLSKLINWRNRWSQDLSPIRWGSQPHPYPATEIASGTQPSVAYQRSANARVMPSQEGDVVANRDWHPTSPT